MSEELTPYQILGGAEKLRALVDCFYDLMNAQPEYCAIRKLHPQDLSGSAEKLKFGQPFLRARHLPFSIGAAERDLWLACMRQAMGDVQVEEGLSDALANAFYKTADHLRNRPEG
jgi:hemoglobin